MASSLGIGGNFYDLFHFKSLSARAGGSVTRRTELLVKFMKLMGGGRVWRKCCPRSSCPRVDHQEAFRLRVPGGELRARASQGARTHREGLQAEGLRCAAAWLGGAWRVGKDEHMSTSESRKPSRSLGLILRVAYRICHLFKSTR